ncbi:MAG: CRISPR-associated endonuclease Cas2 [Bacillota bacterium]|nr:MAG: CRISPR-associated endonuclease Cas2 [Bacillota bacterium]
MFVLITYDVNTQTAAGRTRLRRVAKECVNFGQRVQNSVFEINLEYGKFILLKDRLIKLIDPETDNLRFYYLGNSWRKRIEQFGVEQKYDSEGVLLF